ARTAGTGGWWGRGSNSCAGVVGGPEGRRGRRIDSASWRRRKPRCCRQQHSRPWKRPEPSLGRSVILALSFGPSH
ncbi:unnamed protein product, partial [Pylaiella littoralis]